MNLPLNLFFNVIFCFLIENHKYVLLTEVSFYSNFGGRGSLIFNKSKNMKNSKEIAKFPIKVKSVIPKKRDEILNMNGWGFKDSYFTTKNGILTFTGNR